MANKGHSIVEKRISYQGTGRILKKTHVWVLSTEPGPHAKTKSAPLGVILRDVLKFADNAREVKYILTNKVVCVNSNRIKNSRFPVGIFDVLELKDSGKSYRVFYDSKGYINLKELEKGYKKVRYSIISKKTVLKKNRIQVSLDNGYNFLFDVKDAKGKYNLRDGAVFDYEKKKVVDIIPFAKGTTVYIIAGPHISKSGTIKEIIKGALGKRPEVVIEGNNETLRTVSDYVHVVPNDF